MTNIQENLIQLSIENKELAKKAALQAKEIFKEWGCRQLGKRLADKLRETNNCLYFSKSKDYAGYNEFELTFYFRNRYIFNENVDSAGYKQAFYIKDTHETLIWKTREEKLTPDVIEYQLNKFCEQMRREITALKYTLKNCQKIKKQRAELIEKLNKLMEPTSREACEYLNISTDYLIR